MTPEDLAELRRTLDNMRRLAVRGGVYYGPRTVLDILGRVEPLLTAAAERDALTAAVDRVRALHAARDTQWADGTHYLACWECTDEGTPYPCATIRALDGTPETGGES